MHIRVVWTYHKLKLSSYVASITERDRTVEPCAFAPKQVNLTSLFVSLYLFKIHDTSLRITLYICVSVQATAKRNQLMSMLLPRIGNNSQRTFFLNNQKFSTKVSNGISYWNKIIFVSILDDDMYEYLVMKLLFRKCLDTIPIRNDFDILTFSLFYVL